jgi:hypothetical protein
MWLGGLNTARAEDARTLALGFVFVLLSAVSVSAVMALCHHLGLPTPGASEFQLALPAD